VIPTLPVSQCKKTATLIPGQLNGNSHHIKDGGPIYTGLQKWGTKDVY